MACHAIASLSSGGKVGRLGFLCQHPGNIHPACIQDVGLGKGQAAAHFEPQWKVMSEGVQGRLPLSGSSQSLWLAVWSAWSTFVTEEQSSWASKSQERWRQSRGVPLVPRGRVGGRCRQCSWVSLQIRVGNCARLRMEWLGCFQPLPQVKSWGSASLSVLCLAKTPAPPSWVIFRNRNQFFSGLDLSPSKIGSSPTQHKFLFWGKSKTLVCVCLGKTRGERSWERRFWSQVRTGLLHYFHF